MNIKAKYADGQKIAKRISTQITKETSKMKKLVTEYNVRTSPDPELSMEAVLNPQSTLFDTIWKKARYHPSLLAKDTKFGRDPVT